MHNYFGNLIYKNGIYFSSKRSPVNYPPEGNNTFYEIEDHSFWYQHRNNCIIQAFNKFRPTGSLFEIGGGNGYVSKALQENNFDVILIEPDPNAIKNANERGIKKLICSSFNDLEWTEKKMDNVALFDVLEHIEHDVEFLSTLNNHLKNGAWLCLTVPALHFLFSMEDRHDGHFRRYSLMELELILKKSGFVVEYSTYFFTYLIIPILIFRTLPTKFGFGKFKSLNKYNNAQDVNKYKSDHEAKNKLGMKLLDFLNRLEIKKIKNLHKMPLGASCLIIARKIGAA